MSTIAHSSVDDYPVIDTLRRRFKGQTPPSFELELPDGSISVFGTAALGQRSDAAAPAFRLRLNNAAGVKALSSLDAYAIGVAFLEGDLDIMGDFLRAFELRRYFTDRHPLLSLWRYLRPLLHGQSAQNKKLVPRHYDRGNDFYFTFLDRQHRLYSQALFFDESETLEQAVENKLDYIRSICRIGPGTRVLDVGAGWGSFSRYAATLGANVTMLTVSRAQQKYLRQIIDDSDNPERLQVIREDIYAFSPGQRFDVIVLLGVMEHLPQYQRLLRHFDQLLETDGRIFMDFSAVRRKYNVSTFTYRYVFEGKCSPVYMPELIAAANSGPYEIIAVHNDRHSYFLTLKAWASKLEANRDQLVRDFDEQTYRLFQLYLWSTAFALHSDGDLESYRVVLQKCHGRPSETIGLFVRPEIPG